MVFSLFDLILGFVSSDEIRLALLKLGLELNIHDIESMLKYFNIYDQKFVNIQDFVRNFQEQFYIHETSTLTKI